LQRLVQNFALLFTIENFLILINAYQVNTIHLMTLSYIIILADNTNIITKVFETKPIIRHSPVKYLPRVKFN
jgi:hypothetical protein